MAKVVLVWNEHPTEVVAGFHARKVAKILRERYGHEVIVEKRPLEETIYNALEKNGSDEIFNEIKNRISKSSLQIAKQVSEAHGAPAFNFHASPSKAFGQTEKKQPSEFKIGEKILPSKVNPADGQKSIKIVFPGQESTITGSHEIEFLRHPRQKNYVVEVPGFFTGLPPTIRQMRRKKLRTVEGAEELFGHYFLDFTPLRHLAQQKYLHPAISEKIAAAIHERITRTK